jgi:hypothetical protein
MHDRHPIAERHRFDLIVCHVYNRRTEFPVQPFHFNSHLAAQFRVQIRERLVKQKRRRIPHNRAPKGDTLAFTAGQLVRLAIQQMRDPQSRSRLSYLLVDATSMSIQLSGKTRIEDAS